MTTGAKLFLATGGTTAVSMVLWAMTLGSALAQTERNCDPRAGLVDGSCVVERPRAAWWKCESDTYSTPQEREVTAEQLRHLEDFGLRIFSPELPGYGPEFSTFSRADLIRRFGPPLKTASTERPAYDPTQPPEIHTRWDYPGLRIVTVASKPEPDAFRLNKGEVLDAKVSLLHGVRVGQPIARWVGRFGRPNCSRGHPVYEGERYFACGSVTCVSTYRIELFLDGSGKVQRMAWDHPML